MKLRIDNKTFFKSFVLILVVCLAVSAIYIIHCLRSFYSFDSLLEQESPAKIVHCSLDICSSEDEVTVSIDVTSDLFERVLQALQSEQYMKPLASILGATVSAYHIEEYPFYRILLQHEDHHRTEVVVNGSYLLIGSTTESGLTIYQAADNSLLRELNSLF